MPENPVVILTREARDNREPAEGLDAAGIPVLEYPCIRTRLLPFGKESFLPEGVSVADFHTVVFTSKRGVMGVAESADLFSSCPQIAVVGSATASAVKEILKRLPDVVASPQTGNALAQQLVTQLRPIHKVLHVRGNKTTGTFRQVMEQHNIHLLELEVYRNQPAEIEPLDAVDNAWVVFASPSAARNFFQVNEMYRRQWRFIAIGPTTAGFLNKQGIRDVYTVTNPQHLLTEIINQYQTN